MDDHQPNEDCEWLQDDPFDQPELNLFVPGQLLERQRGSDQPFVIPAFVLLLEKIDHNFRVLCSTGHIILCSDAWLYFYYWEEP